MAFVSTQKQSQMEDSVDKGVSQGSAPSNSFNEEYIGRPITGRKAADVRENMKKYDIFGKNAEVGEHFGRSGSPTGAKGGAPDED